MSAFQAQNSDLWRERKREVTDASLYNERFLHQEQKQADQSLRLRTSSSSMEIVVHVERRRLSIDVLSAPQPLPPASDMLSTPFLGREKGRTCILIRQGKGDNIIEKEIF
jgi:hypothetical protein